MDEMVFDRNETLVSIPDNSCNDTEEFIDINKLVSLQELSIGKRSFQGVSNFNIDQLNELKHIAIDDYSFTTSCNPNPHGSFNVSNCAELESIILGLFSFGHYYESFSLVNLPCLNYLKIGSIGSFSSNFFQLSFCVKGIVTLFAIGMINRFAQA